MIVAWGSTFGARRHMLAGNSLFDMDLHATWQSTHMSCITLVALVAKVTNTIFEKTNTIFRPCHLSTQLREFGMRVLIGIICHLLREPETIIEWTSASKQYRQSQLRQCFKVRTSQKTGMAVFATCLFTGSKRCNCRNSSNPVPAILLFCRGWEGWGLCDLGWKDIISFTNSFPRVNIAMYRSWESILFFLIWIVKFHRCLCDQ